MVVVGLDFGTHQTKICIEDRSDAYNPVYKFWKFDTPEGLSYTFPSVIQVNNDDTLTYGYVDKSCVKEMGINAGQEPQMPNISKPVMSFTETEPKLKLPEKPKEGKKDWKDVLASLNGGVSQEETEWKKACEKAKLDYDQDLHIWKRRYNKAKETYDQEVAAYDKAMQRYEEEHKEWETKMADKFPAIFRYFKQATFSNGVWKYDIDSQLLSIWYIAYILFDLEVEYGQTFSIQMGFPTDAQRLERRRTHAYRLLLSAYHLVENVFEGDKDAFLLSTYQELKEKTEIISPTLEKIEEYGVIALPEAYANLVTATEQGHIEKGISFVVDIGGGTTDISLFEIDEKNAPNIYGYTSIDKGINFIIESANQEADIWKMNSLDDIPSDKRKASVEALLDEVRSACLATIKEIGKAFDKIDLDKSALFDALKNRIIVYSGGGSTYDLLCNRVLQFTDVRKMDQKIWGGFTFDKAEEVRVKSLAPILSTALGLSVQRNKDDGDTIKVLETRTIFDHLPKKGDSPKMIWGRREEDMYGLSDD